MARDLSTIGYCTNVHAGADFATTRKNLERYALAVKRAVSPLTSMGVGLWLSARAAQKLEADGTAPEFAKWLDSVGLIPFTFNGFPHGDFHQRIVKHDVYHPTWFDSERLDYSLRLARLQDVLLPMGMQGSISTLPIAWGQPAPTSDEWQEAAANLRTLAASLARLERDRGRLIYICLEPEPGCLLQRSRDVVWMFEKHLLPGGNEHAIRRHIRVCHDICHSSVMFEEQVQALNAFRAAGIEIGKVQVSAAVRAPFADLAPQDRVNARQQLAGFNEPRYLHQTVVRVGGRERFHEDLSLALSQEPTEGEWRTHFHVPIYLDRFGSLHSTQNDIHACLKNIRQYSGVTHWEIETYAWGVLPADLRTPDLSAGIADEMRWFLRQEIASGPSKA